MPIGTEERERLSPLQEAVMCEMHGSIGSFLAAARTSGVFDPVMVIGGALSSGFSMAIALAVYQPEWFAANVAGLVKAGEAAQKQVALDMVDHFQQHIANPDNPQGHKETK